MKLKEIRESFEEGSIDKHEFIDAMYQIHKNLMDYSSFLKESGISKIEIVDENVIFTSRATHYHNGGLRFFVDMEDKRSTPLEAFNFGSHEAEDSEMLYKLIDKEHHIFDIGGNIGWYTMHIASLLANGKVHAFEPIPDTFRKLVKNAGLNDVKGITLNNLAFSDKKEVLTFYYSPLMSGASSSQNITGNEDAVRVECTTNTIDDFINENNIDRLDFIKCDVEGAELLVFKGGIHSISKYKPVVFSEMLRKWAAKFNYHPNDIIDLFAEIGYHCFIARQGKLVKFGRVDENTPETNFFFLHPEKHHAQISSHSGSPL